MTDKNKLHEYNNIKYILHKNYHPNILDETIMSINEKQLIWHDIQEQEQQHKKWGTFTYIGKQTTYITKLFKNKNVKIAFRTQNTIGHILRHNDNPNQNAHFKKSGIYQLTCPNCKKKYKGQTRRSFQRRYQEHLRDFKYNNGNSKFAQHLTDNKHSFGPIDKVIKILHTIKKGAMMDTIEKYHIYKTMQRGVQINDKHTISSNMLFDTIIQNNSATGHP